MKYNSDMENKKKKTLLERYGIPIHHLDFKYIKDCKDGKEMEKILYILRSNEEGYYPDLMKCAEEKLKELKPRSRLFRTEETIKGREALDPNELKPIYDWNQNIRSTDRKLQTLVQELKPQDINESDVAPIRKGGNILQMQKSKKKPASSQTNKRETPTSQRIKSTDYDKWDKYDPEEEILRADLAEEREQEVIECNNRLKMQQIVKQPLKITEISEQDAKSRDKWSNLSEIEKEKISEDYRLRGNEYFRSKEYDLALKEYTCAIQCYPDKAVAAYNNRALTYFKQQQFLNSIEDCEACLQIEPSNLKACFRLAEASYAYGRRRESYQLYINVLKLDPENPMALKATAELRQQFEDLPPPNATRLHIQDESTKNIVQKEAKKVDKPQSKLQSKPINYDLAELIKPNRIVPNRLVKTAESLGKNLIKSECQKKAEETQNELSLRLPGHSDAKKSSKKLIEEI